MSQGTLHFAVNGFTLDGVKKRGKWTFTCPDFPELEVVHKGAKVLTPVVTDFMSLAIRFVPDNL